MLKVRIKENYDIIQIICEKCKTRIKGFKVFKQHNMHYMSPAIQVKCTECGNKHLYKEYFPSEKYPNGYTECRTINDEDFI